MSAEQRGEAPEKSLGLALGGGASLGAAHVGVLRALEEAGLRPSYFAGTSIGAFVATLHVFGVALDDIEGIAHDLKWFDVAGLALSRMGLLDHSKLGKLLRKHVGDARLEEAPLPLAVVATDIECGERVVLREGCAVEAVLASASIPGLFQPVAHGDLRLVDGGLVSNLPVEVVREMGAEAVVASNLSYASQAPPVESLTDVLLQSMRILFRPQEAASCESADLVISPDMAGFSPMNTSRSADLIESGYQAAKAALRDRGWANGRSAD